MPNADRLFAAAWTTPALRLSPPALLRRILGRMPTLGAAALAVLLLAACGDSAGPEVNPEVSFLVGSWNAESFTVTNPADPTQSLDLLATGAAFVLSVEPSGRYQASLTVLGATSTVFGRLELDGEEVTLFQEFPVEDTQTGTLETLTQDRIRLSAETGFDFDQDGELDPANFTSELARDTD